MLDSEIAAVVKCLKYNFLIVRTGNTHRGDVLLICIAETADYSSGLHRDQRSTGVGPITKFPEQVADSRGQQVK